MTCIKNVHSLFYFRTAEKVFRLPEEQQQCQGQIMA